MAASSHPAEAPTTGAPCARRIPAVGRLTCSDVVLPVQAGLYPAIGDLASPISAAVNIAAAALLAAAPRGRGPLHPPYAGHALLPAHDP